VDHEKRVAFKSRAAVSEDQLAQARMAAEERVRMRSTAVVREAENEDGNRRSQEEADRVGGGGSLIRF
jgi:hypothetical protein